LISKAKKVAIKMYRVRLSRGDEGVSTGLFIDRVFSLERFGPETMEQRDPVDDVAVLIPVISKKSDGYVTPQQLRLTTLPLAMIALILMTCVILFIGSIMAIVMRSGKTNLGGLSAVAVVSFAIAIGVTFG